MVNHHSFSAVSTFSYTDHVKLSRHSPLHLEHVATLDTNAAQAAAFVPLEESQGNSALILIANFYGKSALYYFAPGPRNAQLRQLAVLQTECGHSWTSWRMGGRRWAAVANYCSKGGQKGVVIYELERLPAPRAAPDWGFKAAAALTASGASAVLHVPLPALGGQLLAVAEYEAGVIALHDLTDSEDAAGLAAAPLQRIRLPGVSALAACARGPGGSDLLLVGLSYHDKGFATRSAVYRWDPARRQFALLQVLATSGAHGGRCFTLPPPPPAQDRASPAAKSTAASAGGTVGEGQLWLAIANARSGDPDLDAPGDAAPAASFGANSTLWRFDTHTDRFHLHTSVPTRGAHDVQHVRAAGRDLLVFANRGADEECDAGERSPVYEWDGPEGRWEGPTGHVAAACATGLAAGKLAGAPYLIVAGDRNASGSHEGPLTHVWRVEAEAAGGRGRRRRRRAAERRA